MKNLTRFGVATLLVVMTLSHLGCATTQHQFATPQQAMDRLVTALRADDHEQLTNILGSDADTLLASGDAVRDRSGVQDFLTQYDAHHQLTPDADGNMTVVVGTTDWPMPIPIVKDAKKNTWYFDTAAGKDEMLSRRIGRNELDTIQVCEAIVDAQREYALEDRDGNGIHDYAAKFLSDSGKKNGLFWQTGAGEPPSPLGPLVTSASDEGYRRSDKPQPYHGYRYRMLFGQGAQAKGGEFPYVVNKQMLGGFAVVAYPAEYGNSGIMTFIVNHDGVVYQNDMGKDTASRAAKMTAFNPTAEWVAIPAP